MTVRLFGAWANSHGHGILHLHTSKKSPETFQFGILLLFLVVVAVDVAAMSINKNSCMLAFEELVLYRINSYRVE
jgi:hypothetical protein